RAAERPAPRRAFLQAREEDQFIGHLRVLLFVEEGRGLVGEAAVALKRPVGDLFLALGRLASRKSRRPSLILSPIVRFREPADYADGHIGGRRDHPTPCSQAPIAS